MQIPQPIVLNGRFIRLEPLRPEHAEGLLACSSPDLFKLLMQRPDEWSLRGFQGLVQRLLSQPRQAYVMVVKRSDAIAGCSSFLAIHPEHRGLEIGTTWIGNAHHGTFVNPEAKLLMMQYAIEELGAIRVEYLVRVDNPRSQAAVSKLGAVREGVLRNHTITADGVILDYVSYSVTPSDWPHVKERLTKRLDAFATIEP